MRLLLSLRATKACSYDSNYYHKVQGLLYNRLRESIYQPLHDKQGTKFFCFSNPFPGGRKSVIEEGSKRHLIVSSPDAPFIKTLREALLADKEMNIGEMQFELADAQLLNPRITGNCVLSTATPIIIRIPQYRYAEYGISSDYPYAFWKPEHDFNAFLKQLSENLVKKYDAFHHAKIEEQPLFQQFMYEGTFPLHPVIDHREQTFIGSYWKFIFEGMTKAQQDVLQFGLDCGFGELNSLGFGFVNVVK